MTATRGKTIGPRTTRAELGALVCRALAAIDDEPVLVGGAVVSIYSDGRFVSDDLDFVSWRDDKRRRPAMEALGFHKRGSYFIHPDTELFVQFVNPPVMIGHKHVREPARLPTRAGELRILSPLDCVLDRLAWHLERGDAQTLEQAIDVARTHRVPLDAIDRWLAVEDWPADRKELLLESLGRRLAEPRPRKPRR
ncbi:MAG TPA: hypothetical protein VN947_20025 [Polyangia bacterium]|nr:hypothetical protein [Polyangia bacterium]